MKNNIINELKFASKKKKNAVLGYVYCDYLLDVFEEIERLNKELENLKKLNNANYQSFIEVNNIIKEAIKYIRSNEWGIDYEHSNCRTHLLDILKGSGKE